MTVYRCIEPRGSILEVVLEVVRRTLWVVVLKVNTGGGIWKHLTKKKVNYNLDVNKGVYWREGANCSFRVKRGAWAKLVVNNRMYNNIGFIGMCRLFTGFEINIVSYICFAMDCCI